jgi:hypothetical protein
MAFSLQVKTAAIVFSFAMIQAKLLRLIDFTKMNLKGKSMSLITLTRIPITIYSLILLA